MAQPTRGRNSQAKNHLITIVLALIIAASPPGSATAATM